MPRAALVSLIRLAYWRRNRNLVGDIFPSIIVHNFHSISFMLSYQSQNINLPRIVAHLFACQGMAFHINDPRVLFHAVRAIVKHSQTPDDPSEKVLLFWHLLGDVMYCWKHWY